MNSCTASSTSALRSSRSTAKRVPEFRGNRSVRLYHLPRCCQVNDATAKILVGERDQPAVAEFSDDHVVRHVPPTQAPQNHWPRPLPHHARRVQSSVYASSAGQALDKDLRQAGNEVAHGGETRNDVLIPNSTSTCRRSLLASSRGQTSTPGCWHVCERNRSRMRRADYAGTAAGRGKRTFIADACRGRVSLCQWSAQARLEDALRLPP
jgi:hypothetical protein